MKRAWLALTYLLLACGRRQPSAGSGPSAAASASARAQLPSSAADLFDFGASDRVVGPNAYFEIHAEPRSPAAASALVSITVSGGVPLAEGSSSNDGRIFRGRTQHVALRGGSAFGIVPVSRAEQMETELTARVEQAGAPAFSLVLRVQALARSSGLPNVALGHTVLLRGKNVRIESPLSRNEEQLRYDGEFSVFTPVMRGPFRFWDKAGHELRIEVARYDDVPLDCGRADCHRDIAQSSKNSPMTRALASDLGGCHPLSDPTCALRCHATGEPGAADGGFSQIWRELGQPPLPSNYADLPRALHRVGGVGCLACHGPSAIPRPAESWAQLRSSVCAVCHDASPRYGHVAAFATSRMASADRDPRVRRDPRCATCHTTWGALGIPARRPPDDVEPFGLGCATCHDVHPHAPGVPRAVEPALSLLRDPVSLPLAELPAALRTGPSRVCIACHAPSADAKLPEASAAAMVAGRGGFVPDSGAPLTADAPHARDAKGCLSCHDGGPAGLERGSGHAFAASRERCGSCHAAKATDDLRTRALELSEKIEPHAVRAEPAHARSREPQLSAARARALYDLRLVLEDPAAGVHNPSYARQLLDAAEAALSARVEGKP